MSTLADIRPRQVLGRYEFLAPIAQGGMAAVWAARQWGSRGFSKIVAVKTMLPTISDDPRFERMFLDEARIASKIRHNHVVEILDLGEQNAVLYLVMEWVDGESLSAIRRAAAEQGGVPVAAAVRIIADICSGLHAAHELCDDDGQPFGLVHRDVSPQNILVGYDGVAKVLDFGVAKVAGRASETTNIGHARGKPPYMAPEQALGHVVDRRADIFSLGIVLYQLVAGRHPFRGENDIATLHNIISDQPVVSPKAFVSSLSDGLERVMLQALEREPAKRFQTARAMELALEAVLDTELGRVRTEELGRLVSTWLGPRGEKRRQALREAIRSADSAETTQVDLIGLGSSSQPMASTTASGGGVSVEKTDEVSVGSYGARGASALRTSVDEAGAAPPLRPIGGNWEAGTSSVGQEPETNERTVVDLYPNWRVAAPSVDLAAAKSVERSIRFRGLRRTGLIVISAMCTGALITWASFALRVRAKPIANSVPSTVRSVLRAAATSVVVPTATPVESNSVVEVASTTAPTVTAEPRSTFGARPNNTPGRKRPSGPSYNLPPVPSPGF